MKIKNEKEMLAYGEKIGRQLKGGDVIELVGDIGAGKTTFVKGIAKGLNIEDEIQSPSFTISRSYAARDNLTLNHYDFYRLSDPGLMKIEIAESFSNVSCINIIEWAESIADILPEKRTIINIKYLSDENSREVVAI